MFGTLLTWMQDHQSPIFIVATANNILGAVQCVLPGEKTSAHRHTPAAVLDAIARPQVMANVMTPNLAEYRFNRAMRAEVGQIIDWCDEALTLARDIFLASQGEQGAFASFPSHFMSLVRPDGAGDLYDGGLRVPGIGHRTMLVSGRRLRGAGTAQPRSTSTSSSTRLRPVDDAPRAAVERALADRLRHWWSSQDYRISPLPREYRRPLPPPSRTVSPAGQRLIAGFNRGLVQPATDALDPISVVPTCGAGVTAAAGTSLAHHLFAKEFALGKSLSKT